MKFGAATWVQQHSGLMMIPMFGALASMLAVFWKRHSHRESAELERLSWTEPDAPLFCVQLSI